MISYQKQYPGSMLGLGPPIRAPSNPGFETIWHTLSGASFSERNYLHVILEFAWSIVH